MTRMLIVAGLMHVAFATAVAAQPAELKDALGRGVFVIDANRQEWQGRALKVSAEALEVESNEGIRTFKLAEIRRVDADGDGVGDGAAKGAMIGALMGALAAGMGASPVVILSNALWTGLLGLGIDAGCSSRHPVYHGAAVPHLERPVAENSPALRVKISW